MCAGIEIRKYLIGCGKMRVRQSSLQPAVAQSPFRKRAVTVPKSTLLASGQHSHDAVFNEEKGSKHGCLTSQQTVIPACSPRAKSSTLPGQCRRVTSPTVMLFLFFVL